MNETVLNTLTLPKPDDWHLHLRDGAMMQAVLPYSARHFGRAIVMPNLAPPVRTTAEAAAYRDRILAALPHGSTFTPLMTAYLTDTTNPDDLRRGYEEGIFFAAKLFPAGATTNSDEGVTDVQILSPLFEMLEKLKMPLLFHGESVDPSVDFFDREAVFIERTLIPLRRSFQGLKVVMEHLSTKTAVHYIVDEGQRGDIAGTITPHHLLISRNDLFNGGVKPHLFCLPVVKRESDRQALIQAATSGARMLFAGTDSAPHPRTSKETSKGAGGIFCAPCALSVYAQIFDEADALDHLPAFLSHHGADFYGQPISNETLCLEKLDAPLPPPAPVMAEGCGEVVVFPTPKPLFWRVREAT